MNLETDKTVQTKIVNKVSKYTGQNPVKHVRQSFFAKIINGFSH